MRLAHFVVNGSQNNTLLFNTLNELLQDLALQFETTHVTIVSHDCKDVLDDQQIEVLIEDGGYLGLSNDQLVQCMHGFEADFHQLRLLMLQSEKNGQDNSLELVGGQLEQASGAVLHNLLNKDEADFSEFGVNHEIILDHGKG